MEAADLQAWERSRRGLGGPSFGSMTQGSTLLINGVAGFLFEFSAFAFCIEDDLLGVMALFRGVFLLLIVLSSLHEELSSLEPFSF